ncbi:hypothetical protein BPJM79_30016 [Bacillus pumilus]
MCFYLFSCGREKFIFISYKCFFENYIRKRTLYIFINKFKSTGTDPINLVFLFICVRGQDQT